MFWYKKLTEEERNKLRRTDYKKLRKNNVSVVIARKVRNWRKNYVKLYIENFNDLK